MNKLTHHSHRRELNSLKSTVCFQCAFINLGMYLGTLQQSHQTWAFSLQGGLVVMSAATYWT